MKNIKICELFLAFSNANLLNFKNSLSDLCVEMTQAESMQIEHVNV